MDVKPNNAALIQTYATFLRQLTAKEQRQVWDTVHHEEANLEAKAPNLLDQFGRFSGPESADDLIKIIQESRKANREIEPFE